MAGISQTIYNTFFRKNAVFISTIFVGAFAFELGWSKSVDTIWDQLNKGRQWKDIKYRYMTKGEEDEDEE